MIHELPIKEIENRFFKYLEEQLGPFTIEEHLTQMKGGNEAYLYRFKVSGIEGMEGTQVLRLFPSFYGDEKAEWEAMIQNLLHERGIPVPKSLLSSRDMGIIGGCFLVMDYIEGETIDPGDDMSILTLAAKTQARLHQLDGKPISERIFALGHSENSHNLTGRTNWLLGRAKNYPDMDEIFKWIIENRPPPAERLSVVHGDFHPMNLLVKDGKVEAILDWSGFMVDDPMAGLGWTIGLFLATSKHQTPPEILNGAIQTYLDEYRTISPINDERLDYFIVFRLAMALLEGKDGQEWWKQPALIKNMVEEIEARTGITGRPNYFSHRVVK